MLGFAGIEQAILVYAQTITKSVVLMEKYGTGFGKASGRVIEKGSSNKITNESFIWGHPSLRAKCRHRGGKCLSKSWQQIW